MELVLPRKHSKYTSRRFAAWGSLVAASLLFAEGCGTAAPTPELTGKALWIEDAFGALESENYPQIKAISWWHENFDGTQMRLDSSPQSLRTYSSHVASSLFASQGKVEQGKLIASAGIYHGAFPDFGGTEDQVSAKKITGFEGLVGKSIAWAYLSNNWGNEIRFPSEAIAEVRAAGTLPFVRLMPRSTFEEGGPDPVYTLQAILDGDFDVELNSWFAQAAALDEPILCEFGTEVNGNWFPWNGQYSGAEVTDGYGDPNFPDGPERFRDAYRHVIDLANANGANAITWFFHIDSSGFPELAWNQIELYYPGDSYIDWLGVSIYGPHTADEELQYFSEQLAQVYPTLVSLSDKPIAVLEFAVTELNLPD